MTNGEKFKTAEERRKAYNKYTLNNSSVIDEFSWLGFEFVEELKSCPFCGCDKVKVTSVFEGSPYYVLCTKCKAHSSIFHTIETAVAAWNRRENG